MREWSCANASNDRYVLWNKSVTCTRMFGNFADKPTAIEDRRVIVDVTQYNAHLSIARQWRLDRPANRADGLVVGEHVEVPDRTTSWQVAIQWPGDENFAGVRVDDERSVVGKLTSHCVVNAWSAVQVWISCTNLNNTTSSHQTSSWSYFCSRGASTLGQGACAPHVPRFTCYPQIQELAGKM